MKPITYLCFTLMSIFIQFCLMDFINERIQTGDSFIDHKKSVASNLSYVLKNIKEKPHALYYRDETQRFRKNIKETNNEKYSNSSIQISTFTTSTDFAITLFDLLYDENVSMTDSTVATETFNNESEYDNVTEITFFDIITTPKPSEMPKKNVNTNNCACNLLFNKCDINCCCDSECTGTEHSLFKHCKKGMTDQCFSSNRKLQYFCFFQDTCNRDLSSIFDHLFCIDKVNLPDKRKTYSKNKNIDINKYLKWHTIPVEIPVYKFTKNLYLYGQPVWLLRNETVSIISLPTTVSNSYCSGKKPITFLTNEYIKCYVKIKDLHSLYALHLSTASNVVSPTIEATTNSTTLNCSTLTCINWTVLVCNDDDCIQYDKSLHDPSCSENHCYNIGVKVEYIMYCNESIITRAILKLYIKQVSVDIGFVSQEVKVTFYMGNDSFDDIVTYSGNPGYIKNLPVLVSYSESNHTKHFYNRTHGKTYNLLLPYNQNGKCLITNMTHNILKFGINTRLKCRIKLAKSYEIRKTDGCLKIQKEIIELLQLNHNNIFISPYGNPNSLNDSKWIGLQRFNKSYVYGEYRSKKSQLQCYNLMTRFAYVLTYADIGVMKEENKILHAIVEGTMKNVTFNVQDLSTVLTVDTIFLDANTRGYVGASMNTDSSKNLFFPFRNGNCKSKLSLLLYLCTILFLSK